jgi:hypothetical protein
VKTPAAAGTAVGVDRQRNGCPRPVPDCGPLADARAPACIGRTGENDARAKLFQNAPQPERDVEVVSGLGVARSGLGSGRVTCLLERARVDEAIDLTRMAEVAAVMTGIERDRLSP